MYPNQDPWAEPQQADPWPTQAAPPGPPAGYGPPQPGSWAKWGVAPAPTAPRPVTPPDPDELMSGGHKAATFPDQQFGHTVGGPIVEKPVTTQQLDFDSRQPKFYDDGNPMWQVVVPVQAQQPTEDDDGIRAFYIKAQMKKAVQEAVRRAGASRLEVGGELHVRYVRDEPNSRGRGKPKKIYEARYVPPAGNNGAPTSPAPAAVAPAPQLSDEPPF